MYKKNTPFPFMPKVLSVGPSPPRPNKLTVDASAEDKGASHILPTKQNNLLPIQ